MLSRCCVLRRFGWNPAVWIWCVRRALPAKGKVWIRGNAPAPAPVATDRVTRRTPARVALTHFQGETPMRASQKMHYSISMSDNVLRTSYSSGVTGSGGIMLLDVRMIDGDSLGGLKPPSRIEFQGPRGGSEDHLLGDFNSCETAAFHFSL